MGYYLLTTSEMMIDANAAIRELADLVDDPQMEVTWDFICECGDDDCLESVPLTAGDFDSLQACGEPVLAIGHALEASATHTR